MRDDEDATPWTHHLSTAQLCVSVAGRDCKWRNKGNPPIARSAACTSYDVDVPPCGLSATNAGIDSIEAASVS